MGADGSTVKRREIDDLQKLGRSVNAKLLRALGSRRATGFAADCDACVELMKMDPPDIWYSGRVWEIVQSRFKSSTRAAAYMARLEEFMIWRFGDKSDLEFHNNYYKYPDHPVTCFTMARAQKPLRHVSDEAILAEIRPRASTRFGEPPRDKASRVMTMLRYRHGLFCDQCHQVIKDHSDVFGDWTHPDHVHFWWGRLGICEQCANSRTVGLLSRQQKTVLQERRFKAAVAEKRRVQNEQRAKHDADFAARREAARLARERGKIERDAAYQFVKEMGLLDQAKQLKGDGDEACKTN